MELRPKSKWLNRTVLGVGLTSLFSDWAHETATAVLPAFLAVIGAGPAWLGAIEGISDGLSSFSKLWAGHYTDRLQKRKPLVLAGYAITALDTASFAFATQAYNVLFGRVFAWLGRGVRSPSKKALLAADVPPGAYGRAFGFERLDPARAGRGGKSDGVRKVYHRESTVALQCVEYLRVEAVKLHVSCRVFEIIGDYH